MLETKDFEALAFIHGFSCFSEISNVELDSFDIIGLVNRECVDLTKAQSHQQN